MTFALIQIYNIFDRECDKKYVLNMHLFDRFPILVHFCGVIIFNEIKIKNQNVKSTHSALCTQSLQMKTNLTKKEKHSQQ